MTMTTELMIARILKAPRAAVWRAWAEPAQFEKWWIPAPMACRVVKMDLWPGGGFETLMSEDGGAYQPHVEGCFLDVMPGARIVFTTVLKEGWQPCGAWLAMTSIVTMEDVGKDGGAHTKYVARALHRTPEEAKKHEGMGFYDGWGSVIDQLDILAATL